MSTVGPGRASTNGRGSNAWYRPWSHLRVDRRSLGYCRVTFDHPPINTVTGTTVAELTELVELIEQDPDLKVVVFDSAQPDFYLEGDPTELPGWSDLLVRLSRAPVISIASIRGGAAARAASSCWPVTCASPRARTTTRSRKWRHDWQKARLREQGLHPCRPGPLHMPITAGHPSCAPSSRASTGAGA